MKGLVCKVCGYVALDGNEDLCPVCQLKNVFEKKEDAYRAFDFKATSGETEKKHIPHFTIVQKCGLTPQSCDGVGVHIKIGEILHPSTPEHYIDTITFYVDNKLVSNVMLTADACPVAAIHLKNDVKCKVQVIENCNVHGRWFNEIEK
ncbi:MAG: hypothetical protein LBU29_03845 [Endomicrobium sp.]|jgi:superoxide reductase|nr:hypothetical protein [Endomicrobium sp.]